MGGFYKTGKIYEIKTINENVSQIVFRQKNGSKWGWLAVSVSGYWNEKFKAENLKQKDRIKGYVFIESNAKNDRYYTNAYFKEIFVIERAPIKMTDLFDSPPKIDFETGEILSD